MPHRPSFATVAAVVCMQIGILAPVDAVAARKRPHNGDAVRLTARVIDGRSGEGLPGAVIEPGGIVERYVTGVDGRVEIEVPKGRCALTVRGGRCEVLSGDPDVFEPGEFTPSLERVGTIDRTATATLAARGQNPPGIPMKQCQSAQRVSAPQGGRLRPWEIRAAMHPRRPLRLTALGARGALSTACRRWGSWIMSRGEDSGGRGC